MIGKALPAGVETSAAEGAGAVPVSQRSRVLDERGADPAIADDQVRHSSECPAA